MCIYPKLYTVLYTVYVSVDSDGAVRIERSTSASPRARARRRRSACVLESPAARVLMHSERSNVTGPVARTRADELLVPPQMTNTTNATDEVEVVVVGGGFCGVALAAALRHFGVSFALLESGPAAGAGFGGHYDRLRLHTPRHRLLHDGDLESRGNYPMYKSKSELVRYLNEYCALHGLRPGVELHYETPVASIAREPPRDGWPSGWAVTTETGRTYHAKSVALCTGAARVPHIPCFASHQHPGTSAFLQRGGEVVHSRHYGNGSA
eukprot:COSAG02_NODE_7720_length_2875_cov_209.079251_1_plen_267_part_00